ncbi:MAG: DUF1624 domain-containing protein [Shinella sp.]|nr:DUF1624 domain-containing protein [Shinella sp.]
MTNPLAADTAKTEDVTGSTEPARIPRIDLIDQLRGAALVAMAIYHFTWDLEFFGYIEPGTAGTGGWKLFARLIAGSFLFLAGVSLVLGHGRGLRWRPFLIRLAKIAGAALLITVATRFAFPDNFIFFGILHFIAAASLVGLVFLHLPVAITVMAAAAAFLAPLYLRSAAFDHPALWWVGLSASVPRSNDYVPLLPWLAAFLLGIAVCRSILSRGLAGRLAAVGAIPSRWKTLLTKAGRHSLAIYLLHQPILIALVYGFSLVMPPAQPDPVENYRTSCVSVCEPDGGTPFCRAFCDCTLNRLIEQDLFDALNRGAIDTANDQRIAGISAQCTAEADINSLPGSGEK